MHRQVQTISHHLVRCANILLLIKALYIGMIDLRCQASGALSCQCSGSREQFMLLPVESSIDMQILVLCLFLFYSLMHAAASPESCMWVNHVCTFVYVLKRWYMIEIRVKGELSASSFRQLTAATCLVTLSHLWFSHVLYSLFFDVSSVHCEWVSGFLGCLVSSQTWPLHTCQ